MSYKRVIGMIEIARGVYVKKTKYIVRTFCPTYLDCFQMCGIFFVYLIRGPPFYQFKLKDLD